MNKKFIAKNDAGKLIYCILDGTKDFEKQFNVLFCDSENPRNGLCAELEADKLALVDYYHAERIATYSIIRIEDTESEPQLKWSCIEE